MLEWYQRYKEAKRETKLFIINAFLYTAVVVLTTIYCYARLDFVRSYDTTPEATEKSDSNT